MMITARIEKDGSWWGAHCDIAGVFTQGKSESEARQALADAFEDVVDDPSFKVTVTPVDDAGTVVVESNDLGKLIAVVLRYQREVHKLSLAEVANKIGASSRNAYARYEQGAIPKLETLLDVLKAIAPEITLALVERKPTKARRSAKDATMADSPPVKRIEAMQINKGKGTITRVIGLKLGGKSKAAYDPSTLPQRLKEELAAEPLKSSEDIQAMRARPRDIIMKVNVPRDPSIRASVAKAPPSRATKSAQLKPSKAT